MCWPLRGWNRKYTWVLGEGDGREGFGPASMIMKVLCQTLFWVQFFDTLFVSGVYLVLIRCCAKFAYVIKCTGLPYWQDLREWLALYLALYSIYFMQILEVLNLNGKLVVTEGAVMNLTSGIGGSDTSWWTSRDMPVGYNLSQVSRLKVLEDSLKNPEIANFS